MCKYNYKTSNKIFQLPSKYILTQQTLKNKLIMESIIDQQRLDNMSDMAHKLRIHAIEMTDASGSG
jgi:hypothetical protein